MVLEIISSFQEVESKEREFDAADFHIVIPCATKSSIEAQFQYISNSIVNKFEVIYYAISWEVKCQSLLFESKRILCRHSLSTLGFEQLDKSKKIKRRHTHIKSSYDKPLLEPRSKRFDDLVFPSHNICEFA
ncbi:hypothetical protein Ahy_B05g078777 [Arachis hypogaea]|uniref:SWIM-type domain-containing protein n=1 Tax=Arachis hypogaea TaxID=3818 RepID=A0A444Z7Y6_ARAHY|nr:hypothetical protein Ahy_B05g078777 [Arachis hypogaea]